MSNIEYDIQYAAERTITSHNLMMCNKKTCFPYLVRIRRAPVYKFKIFGLNFWVGKSCKPYIVGG